MESDMDRILISREQIARRVCELGEQISETYAADEQAGLTLVTVLSGSLIFAADLIRCLPFRMKLGLITVSSYKGTSPGQPSLIQQLKVDVRDRHVLVVDDILDTGATLRLVQAQLAAAGPKSLRTCVLLRKPDKAPADVPAEFVGFDIENSFVVGYGLDYNDHYRNLPDIGVLKPEVYEEKL